MKGPIGHTFMYNIIILFIFIVFAFIGGILSYYKGYKINNKIVGSIEKFEGYNKHTLVEINKNMGNLGYKHSYQTCDLTYKGMYLVEVGNEEYNYCIYASYDPNNKSSIPKRNGDYYQYGVLTYMDISLPLIRNFSIPIFTKTNRIYKFTEKS